MSLPPFSSLPPSMHNATVAAYYRRLQRRRGQLAAKRTLDLAVSLPLLALSLPLMGGIALAVSLESPGGPVFRQRRVTQGGKIFTIYKFRTMRAGSGHSHRLTGQVTRVGEFLRTTRLDELPQLVNILRGEMSLVGPRPEVESFVKHYTPEMLATLLLPAGVTSRASIVFRNEAAMLPARNRQTFYIRHILPAKMRYNLDYLENFSILEDIGLLADTCLSAMGR